jgi:hypothetical protein
VGVVAGELVHRPPLAFLSGVPRRIQGLALALAALALAAGIAVWFLAQPGHRGPLVERVPALQGILAALEAALNLPPETEEAATAAGGGAAGGGGGAGGAALPNITTFELQAPAEDGAGGYTLAWQVEGAQAVSLSGTPQPDAKAGTLALDTLQDAEYVLEATNDAGTVTKSVAIVVLRPPEIQEFTAVPAAAIPGQTVTLSWRVKRAERASLNGEKIDPSAGSRAVTLSGDSAYTLVVENELGRSQQTVRVSTPSANAAVVSPSPSIAAAGATLVSTPASQPATSAKPQIAPGLSASPSAVASPAPTARP